MQSRVPDAAVAIAWYTKLLGRAPDFVPDETIGEWQLYPGCWLVVVEARPDPGRNRIRFGVQNLLEEKMRLSSELGISVSEVSELEGIVAYCDFEDPYDNRLGLFQDLSKYPKSAGV